jgi:hypothetical protein
LHQHGNLFRRGAWSCRRVRRGCETLGPRRALCGRRRPAERGMILRHDRDGPDQEREGDFRHSSHEQTWPWAGSRRSTLKRHGDALTDTIYDGRSRSNNRVKPLFLARKILDSTGERRSPLPALVLDPVSLRTARKTKSEKLCGSPWMGSD